MRFAHAQGMVTRDEHGWRFALILEEATGTIEGFARDATDLVAAEGGAWVADQLAQEAIGVTLAEQGWEPLSSDDAACLSTDGLVLGPRWTLRNLYQ